MAANAQRLVKDWIQYLKNTQVVGLQSDPDTGKLQYKRKVTSDDVSQFLELKTDYTPEQISNAIHIVLAKNAQGGKPQKIGNNPTPPEPETPPQPGTDVSTWMHYGMRPVGATNRLQGEPAEQPKQIGGKPNNKLNYDPNSVSDIDYRDVPNKNPEALPAPTTPKRKPRFKLRTKGVNEDFEQPEGLEVDENDVEQIFNILVNGDNDKPATPATQAGRAAPAAGSATKPDATVQLNKIKRAIRDTMTDAQRKSLWRALNEI